MFGQRTLLGLGSIALGVVGFQAPAQAGDFSFGLNLNLGPQRPAYYGPTRAQYVAPVVPARVIQPTYYAPAYVPAYAPPITPVYRPAFSPVYRLPTPDCDHPSHGHQHNNFQQSNWRYNTNRPYWR